MAHGRYGRAAVSGRAPSRHSVSVRLVPGAAVRRAGTGRGQALALLRPGSGHLAGRGRGAAHARRPLPSPGRPHGPRRAGGRPAAGVSVPRLALRWRRGGPRDPLRRAHPAQPYPPLRASVAFGGSQPDDLVLVSPGWDRAAVAGRGLPRGRRFGVDRLRGARVAGLRRAAVHGRERRRRGSLPLRAWHRHLPDLGNDLGRRSPHLDHRGRPRYAAGPGGFEDRLQDDRPRTERHPPASPRRCSSPP